MLREDTAHLLRVPEIVRVAGRKHRMMGKTDDSLRSPIGLAQRSIDPIQLGLRTSGIPGIRIGSLLVMQSQKHFFRGRVFGGALGAAIQTDVRGVENQEPPVFHRELAPALIESISSCNFLDITHREIKNRIETRCAYRCIVSGYSVDSFLDDPEYTRKIHSQKSCGKACLFAENCLNTLI